MTKNLFKAITTLVYSLKVKYLWVDAMCINQADAQVERPQQVSLMGRIFEGADEVLVWLGHSLTATGHFIWSATTFVNVLDRVISTQGESSVLGRSIVDAAFVAKLGGVESLVRVQKAMHFYGRCRLFNRAWVVQEFANAKRPRVFCGNREIPLHGLKKLGDWFGKSTWSQTLGNYEFYQSEDSLVTPFTRQQFCGSFTTWQAFRNHSTTLVKPSGMASLFQGGSVRQPKVGIKHTFAKLLKSMWRLQRFQVSDPRDKIFAALGFHTDSDSMVAKHLGPPNYTRTIEDTYVEFAKSCLLHSSSLGLFWYLNASQCRLNAGRPSWVPDWRSPIPTPISFLTSKCNVWMNDGVDGLPSKAVQHIGGVRNRLGLQGIRISTITSLAMVKSQAAFESAGTYVLECLRLCSSLPRSYRLTTKPQESHVQALWKTMLLDSWGQDDSSRSPEEQKTWFNAYVASELGSWLRRARIEGTKELAMKELEELYSSLEAECLSWDLPTLEEVLNIESSIPRQGNAANAAEDAKLRPIAERAMKFYSLLSRYGIERRVFRTADNMLGCGSELVRPGDHVWALKGLNTPVVLRPMSGSNNLDFSLPMEFKIVGECYLHGCMYGDLFSSGTLSKDSAEPIVLV